MATLTCNAPLAMNQRTMTVERADPDPYQAYCTPNITVPAFCAFPSTAEPTYFDQGQPVPTRYVSLGREYVLDQLKTNPSFRTQFTNATGCPVNEDGTTGCEISNPQATFESCSPFNFDLLCNRVTYSYLISVTALDPRYRPICCNADNATLIKGTDPFTGQPFNPGFCAEEWCTADPEGQCLDIFAGSCTGTSSCFRQRLLTPTGAPSTDPLISSLSITGQLGPNGLQCGNYYNTTVDQASDYTLYGAQSNTILVRMAAMQNISRLFCSDPATRGNGECACINAYKSAGLEGAFGNPDPDAVSQLYAAAPTLPILAVQDDSGQYRRVDAFCASPNDPNWFAPLSYTLNGGASYITFSNACSTTTPWSPAEYPFPTLNPNRSLYSSTNFGDVAANPIVAQQFLGASNPFALPPQCWIPACTEAGGVSQNTFIDLFALNTPCPSVCYNYSAASTYDISGVINPDALVNIGNRFFACQAFQSYNYNPLPFGWNQNCPILDILVPTNYSSTLALTVTNGDLDISSLTAIKSLSVYSGLPDLVTLGSNSVARIDNIPIYKYSYSQNTGVSVQDQFVLSITVNSTGYTPMQYDNSIVMRDNLGNQQQLNFRVTIFPDRTGNDLASNSINPVACGTYTEAGACVPCGTAFGSNSLLSGNTYNTETNLNIHGMTADGYPIVQWNVASQTLPPYTPLSVQSLIQTGAGARLLSTGLLGQRRTDSSFPLWK